MNNSMPSMQESFQDAKGAYQAARPSRFRRQRTGLGGTADAHYREIDFWNIREFCRDMDRNDALVGQMIDRAVNNALLSPLTPVPQTPDEELNKAAKAKWDAWAPHADRVDIARKFNFHQGCKMMLRHRMVDGDSFALPLGVGALQFIEGDRVNSPPNLFDQVVHGVEVDSFGGPSRYWLVVENQKRRKHGGHRLPFEFNKRAAYDEQGFPNVLHLIKPKRFTQSRGMSVLTPVFDLCGQFEDLNFAKVVQQQFAACVAVFINRERDFQMGGRTTENREDGTTATLEKMSPGMIVRGKAGESMTAFSPNVTPPELFDHMKLLLRMIGANVGLPLYLVLMDSSGTVFHGYRGEFEQAKIGFMELQNNLIERFCAPIWRWKMREWFGSDPRYAALVESGDLYRHRWSRPGWPYIDPLTDAKADSMAMENLLVSPRDLSQRRGQNWNEIVSETVADRSFSIRSAAAAAEQLNKEFPGIAVTWRDVLNLKPQTGVSISENKDQTISEGSE